VLGVNDYFQCMDGETGEVKWSHSLSEEYGMINTYGGRTNRPIVHGTNVIISGIMVNWGANAPPNHRFLAFDKRNGAPVWFSGTRNNPYDTTYSSPVIGVVGGQTVLVQGGGDGAVHCFQVGTGLKLWSYNVSRHGLNATPLLVGDRVYCGHSEENLDTTAMGAVFCIDAVSGEQIWKTDEIMMGRTAPILIDGRLYIIDDRCKLFVLNSETGEIVGERGGLGTVMESCPIYADGKLYVSESNGRFWILRPTPDGAEDVFSLRLRNHDLEGSPIVANGRIYIPSSEALYCIGNAEDAAVDDAADQDATTDEDADEATSEDAPDSDEASNCDDAPPVEVESEETDIDPDPSQEPSRSEDPEPAQLVLVPCEVLLRPGKVQPFQARVYNSRGQFLDVLTPDEVEFSLTGPGEISPEGKLSLPEDLNEQAAITVTAKYGDLTGAARVRFVPDLPWSYDFDNGDIPVTWVGLRYRHVTVDFDLLTTFAAESPLTRDLYIYIRTGFVNGRGATELVYDDSTPAEQWKKLLAFLSLDTEENKPRDLAQAQAALDPALQRLKDERVIAGWEWSTWDRDVGNGMVETEPSLKVLIGERNVEGNGVMLKVTTIPLGTRSQGWMGRIDLSGYTIQADVMAYARDNQLPGIGLQAQRYRIELLGASQTMQISTWLPQVNTHVAGNAPFELKPDVWYTLKFQASMEEGQAVLRGKAWVRGEEEPADWLVVVTDSRPNIEGAPGLAGDAKVAEIFYDNLLIYPNDSPPTAESTDANDAAGESADTTDTTDSEATDAAEATDTESTDTESTETDATEADTGDADAATDEAIDSTDPAPESETTESDATDSEPDNTDSE
jgi:outer membrane protein assembly factor BamB